MLSLSDTNSTTSLTIARQFTSDHSFHCSFTYWVTRDIRISRSIPCIFTSRRRTDVCGRTESVPEFESCSMPNELRVDQCGYKPVLPT